jgi:hypothetical protein
MHAETIMEACKAAAEDYLDDTAGLHHQLFSELLLTSIELDRSLEPRILGDYAERDDETISIPRNNTTFEGVEY